MVLFKFCDFFIVSFLFEFKLLSQLSVLLGAILNVWVFYFLVGLQSDFVLFFQSLHLLSVDDIKLLLFEFQFFLWPQDLELQFLDCLVLLLYSVDSLKVQVVGALGDSLPVLRFHQTVSFFFFFLDHTRDTKTQHSSILWTCKQVILVVWSCHTHQRVGMGI